MGIRGRVRAAQVCAGALVCLLFALWIGAAGSTYYVDATNSACSNSGPGTASAPYCSISAAVSARAAAGVAILVQPATYREQVTVPVSGSPSSPFVLQALGAAVVDGSENLSSASLWARHGASDTWLAGSVSWSPKQVFVDGVRLAASSSSVTSMPAGTFRYVSGKGLYANVGGGNPGTHQTFVGRRLHGFRLAGRSWVTIDGFDVTRTEDKGIYLSGPSDSATVQNCVVTYAYRYGISVTDSDGTLLKSNRVSDNADHGLHLGAGTAGAIVEGNEAFGNFRPSSGGNGLRVEDSTGNLIQGNVFYDNQDSGVDLTSSADDNVLLQNRSWSNGDHGFNFLDSRNALLVGNVAWGNFRNGFFFQGTSPGGKVFNCIVSDNGLTTGSFDLNVDSGAKSGFSSNYNLFWSSGGRPPVRYDPTQYATVAAFAAATGHEARGVQSNPRFADPGEGDFHLGPGSPAIDSASSSVPGWAATDAEGNARKDDPSVPNTGAGPVPYADRGALEVQPPPQPPAAQLVVTPAAGVEPLSVTANASGSTDLDGTIASFLFDFGDGAVVGPQPGPVATHTYAEGQWTASVTVMDNDGQTDSASVDVMVEPRNEPPVASLSVAPLSGPAPLSVTANASSSVDPDGTIVSYRFEFGDGGGAGPQPGPTAAHTYAAGQWTATVTVTDDGGLTDTASRSVSVSDSPDDPVAHLELVPSSGTAPLQVTADASGSTDADGTIVSFLFDFGDGVVIGPQMGPTAAHTYGAGTWVARVTVTDDDGKQATSQRSITVAPLNRSPVAQLVVTPSSGAAPLAVTASASSSFDPDGTIVSYLFDFGDGSVAGPQPGAAAAHTYAAGDWTATVTVQDDGGATAAATAQITATSGPPPDEIHWTITGQTSVTFDWRGSLSNDRIRYGTSAGVYTQTVAGGAPSPMPNSSPGPFWEARLTGLQEDTAYFYRIGNGPESTFRTPPPRGTSGFWFAQLADIGSSQRYPGAGPTHVQIAADNPTIPGDDRPRFVLPTGDLAYGDQHGSAAVDNHFNDVMVWSRWAAYMPAWGNHEDDESPDNRGNYEGRFDFPNSQDSPTSPASGGPGEEWYWFDYGNIRFIAYPEPQTGNWLDWRLAADPIMAQAQSDLAITFIVTFGHRPAYSSGSDHGNEEALAGYMEALRAEHSKYVLNLQGHSHHYERSHPDETGEILQIVSGGGGATLGGLSSSRPGWSAFRMEHLQHLKIRVGADRIEGFAVCGPDGAGNSDDCVMDEVIDAWTILAPANAPPEGTIDSPAGDVTIPEGGSVTFEGTGSDPDGHLPLSYRWAFTAPAGAPQPMASAGAGRPDSQLAESAIESQGDIGLGTLSTTPTESTLEDPGPLVFPVPGIYQVTFTVTDGLGLADPTPATRTVTVTANQAPNGAIDQPAGPATVTAGGSVTFAATGSDPDGHLPLSYQWDFGGGAAPQSVEDPGPVAFATAGVYAATLTVTDGLGLADPTPATRTVTVTAVNQAPTAALVVSPSSGSAPLVVTVNASGSADADGSIVSYRFDFGDGVTVGPQASPTAGHTYGAGNWTASVQVTDDDGGVGTASAVVTVSSLGPNLVGNSSFETGTSGWGPYSGSTIARVGGGFEGSYALEVRGPSSTAVFGVNDSPSWVSSTPTVGTRYRISGWARSDLGRGQVQLRIREYKGGSQVGSTTHSAPVALAASWREVTMEFVTAASASLLDLQVVDTPAAASERFLLDEVSMRIVP